MSDPIPTEGELEKPGEVLAGKAKSAYNWWNNLATLDANDPVWLMVAKLGVRAVGILVLLAMSPFILLGVLLALAAIS